MLPPLSCKKRPGKDPGDTRLAVMTASAPGENIHIFSDATGSAYTYTQLGRQYASVFNVENVKNAWNALSDNKISSLQPSHLYIKFTPSTLEELNRLGESGIPLYTYPLDYEVLRYGDYMQDPALEPNGIPAFYTCLPAASSIPHVSYELLDELYLLDLRSAVAKKAFALAGESAVYPGDAEPGEEVPPALLTQFTHLEHHVQLPDMWIRENHVIVEPPPPPPPPPPLPADNRTTPGEIANACNCSLNEDDRKPSGCITVQETRFGGFQGVNDVLVEFGGPFFQRAAAVTNRFGCFKSNIIIRHKIFGERLQVAMRVNFVTDKKTIRGINHGDVIECTMPLTVTIHDAQSGGLNTESVIFYHSTDVDGNGAKFYTAATVNNAIYEFDFYAGQDGLPKLGNNLKVMVHKYSGAGAAPMFHKLLSNGSIPTASLALFATAVGGVLPVAGGMGNLLNNVPPDIMIGYDTDPWAFETDQVKERSYHELAHALHYQKAGNGFWEHEIDYVIERQQAGDNPPYGSPGAPGAGRCDLVEMWGVYLGKEYAHRRYGPILHSRFAPALFGNSWYADNERVVLWDGDGDNTPANNHIPGGFLQDIRDDNAYNSNNDLDEAPGIADNIRGYAASTIYSHLSGSTTDAATLMNLLAGQLPPGNTLANFNALRAGYGY